VWINFREYPSEKISCGLIFVSAMILKKNLMHEIFPESRPKEKSKKKMNSFFETFRQLLNEDGFLQSDVIL